MGFKTCMFFGALMDQNIPFGANDDTTLRCLDRWGRAEPARGGTDDDGGVPTFACLNGIDDDCDGVSSGNLGGGTNKIIDVSAGGSSALNTRSTSSNTNDSSSNNYIIIIAVIAVAYLIFKKK